MESTKMLRVCLKQLPYLLLIESNGFIRCILKKCMLICTLVPLLGSAYCSICVYTVHGVGEI